MTPAEFKTLRESLGLTAQWIADNAPAKPVQVRTVRYWETGRNQVPDDVVDLIKEIDEKFTSAAIKKLSQIQTLEAERGIDYKNRAKIPLWRYSTPEELAFYFPEMAGYPLSAHAALIWRTKKLMKEHGYSAYIDYKKNDPALKLK